MRIFLLLLLSVTVFASDAAQAQGQLRNAYGQQTYAPQTYAPQTYAPPTYSPQTHSPQGWSPQNGDTRSRPTPRRRLVKCMMSDDPNDFCVFYSDRDFRRGSACSCDGSRGSTN